MQDHELSAAEHSFHERPDFGRELLLEAISQYRARDRRFGGLSRRSSA
jgi:undecaprenyl pyrophosphate synthase